MSFALKHRDQSVSWSRPGASTSRETRPYDVSPQEPRKAFGPSRPSTRPAPHAQSIPLPIGHSVSPSLGQVLRTSPSNTNFIGGIRTSFTVKTPHKTSKRRPKTAPNMPIGPAKPSIDLAQSDNRLPLPSNSPPAKVATRLSSPSHSGSKSESWARRKGDGAAVEPSIRDRLAFFSTVTAVQPPSTSSIIKLNNHPQIETKP